MARREYRRSRPLKPFAAIQFVHKALVDSLGVKKLYAVAGASGGSVQAVEWTVLYPDFVDRAIPVISPGLSISPWAVALLDIWVAPIKADPKWNNGDYYATGEPLEGIALALKLVTITTRHWNWVERSPGRSWPRAGASCRAAIVRSGRPRR